LIPLDKRLEHHRLGCVEQRRAAARVNDLQRGTGKLWPYFLEATGRAGVNDPKRIPLQLRADLATKPFPGGLDPPLRGTQRGMVQLP